MAYRFQPVSIFMNERNYYGKQMNMICSDLCTKKSRVTQSNFLNLFEYDWVKLLP